MLNSTQSTNNQINKKALIGAAIGTAAPVCCMLKKQQITNPLKLEYNLKDMITLSASSIAGGVAAGCILEAPQTQEKKVKEGVFQFINASFPAIFSTGALKLCKKSKHFNNNAGKICAIAGGVIAGMFLGVKTTNKIFDPKDEHPDRKLSPKDCIANIDDVIGALTLAKIPMVQNLQIDKLLPAVYTYCGYRAGKNN